MSERWIIDGVEFDVDAALGLPLAHGTFEKAAGLFEVGPDGTTIELTVDTRSVVTHNRMLDNLARSNELSGPVRLTSTRVSDSGQGRLYVEGRLEAGGRVVPVAFDAVVHRVGDGLRLEATTTLDEHQLGSSSGPFGMILPVTVHVRANLRAAERVPS